MIDFDSRITKEIKESLDKEMSESAMDINVNSRDGFVTLSGMADTLAEKRAAEEISTTIRGIKGIENNITISTDGSITDKQIEAEVINKLRNSSKREEILGVSAQVSDGVAVLKGSVDTLRGRKYAVNEAEKAFGVKDVVSNIRITSAGRYDDASITNKLTRELSETDLSLPDIFMDVGSGTVHIKGHVRDRQEMELAVEIAEGIEGVTRVDNRLKWR